MPINWSVDAILDDVMNRTQYVLIDFENVQPSLEPLLKVENVRVILFVGAKQTQIPVDIVMAMQQLGSRASYQRLSVNSKNTLDFAIACEAGKLWSREATAAVHIISKDKDFDGWISNEKANKKVVFRVESAEQLAFLKTVTPPTAIEVKTKLAAMGNARPRKLSTLKNHLRAAYSLEPESKELSKILKDLQQAKVISVDGDKLSYHLD